ncbi:MAG: HisA/HisF family protein [archaeon]|nr:HisA/HisF family protein [archaeon]MCP8314451.1 HisA/HisF family protein [archaeon]MCP8319990.1 HisA/HisF family protein [archaeon]
MRVIPVIDIMGGVAVHARGGERDEYKPIKSQLCETSNPIDLALTFESNFGFRELYIADLDSIMGRGDNMNMLRRIYESSSMRIMMDSGINDVKKARDILQAGVEKVIVGTETLTSFEVLKSILKFAGYEHVIVSIDIKNGKILSKCEEIFRLSLETLAKRLKLMGIKELIVLDLSRVGSESGVNIDLIRRVLDLVDIPIITGGGIRNIDDVLLLRDLGISGILMSTALHNLKIKREDLLKL